MLAPIRPRAGFPRAVRLQGFDGSGRVVAVTHAGAPPRNGTGARRLDPGASFQLLSPGYDRPMPFPEDTAAADHAFEREAEQAETEAVLERHAKGASPDTDPSPITPDTASNQLDESLVGGIAVPPTSRDVTDVPPAPGSAMTGENRSVIILQAE